MKKTSKRRVGGHQKGVQKTRILKILRGRQKTHLNPRVSKKVVKKTSKERVRMGPPNGRFWRNRGNMTLPPEKSSKKGTPRK